MTQSYLMSDEAKAWQRQVAAQIVRGITGRLTPEQIRAMNRRVRIRRGQQRLRRLVQRVTRVLDPVWWVIGT